MRWRCLGLTFLQATRSLEGIVEIDALRKKAAFPAASADGRWDGVVQVCELELGRMYSPELGRLKHLRDLEHDFAEVSLGPFEGTARQPPQEIYLVLPTLAYC